MSIRFDIAAMSTAIIGGAGAWAIGGLGMTTTTIITTTPSRVGTG